ncbi:MAG: hypothetical protein RSG59_07550 [Ruthenibacterium sp.]
MADLKGVSKRVIEIVEPQHAYIERVLVVLKADSPPVRVGTRRSEAEKYVASLVCWRRSAWPRGVRGWCVALGCAACLAGAAALIFLL